MDNMNLFTENLGDFILMNKDVQVAEFSVINVMGDQDIEIRHIIVSLPFWLTDLRSFIINRRAPKNRENIEELLKLSGCDTILGYLNISHSLSLIDTYWVKPTGSNLCWRDVSLYDKAFNEVIAKTAFEGGLHGIGLSDTSPEYGTDGTFAKCWVRENGITRLMKRGSAGAKNAGQEPYSEYYTAQIAEALGLEHATYDLRNVNNRICSLSECFTNEQYGYLPYSAIDKSSPTTFSVIKTYSDYGFETFAKEMFVFDAIILNTDRHKGNFGFILNNDSQLIIKPAPLFDHNLSFLCYALEDDFTNGYIEQLKPCIGTSFIQSAKAIITSDMKKKLIRLKGFEFKRHSKYNLPEWRLKKLESLVNKQIELILN